MTDSKRFFIRKTIVLSAVLTLYLFMLLFKLESVSNILSMLCAYAAAGILFFSYLKSDRTTKVSLPLLFLSLACLSWGVADTVWAIISFAGGDPEEVSILWIVYVLTNCFLLVSLAIFAINQFKKWDLVQSLIDVAASGLLTAVLFWIVFLNKNLSALNALLSSDFTGVLSILTDILICIIIFSWFLSVRSGKIPVYMRIIACGLVLFALGDMVYYYLLYHGQYIPNSLIDFVYICALVIIAFGALWRTYKSSTASDLNVVTNIGRRRRWIYLLLYPVCIIALSYLGIIHVRFTADDYILLLIPVLIYWALCKYVQISLEKEAALKHDNNLLEQRVAEQVKELSFLANQDTLTTLYNRRYFMACLDDTLATRREGDLTALLLIDVDRFKTINDTYGHDVGDKVLLDISNRMVEWNRCGAVIARLGGDEFALLLNGQYSRKDIEDLCDQLIELCSQRISFMDMSFSTTISLGVALSADGESDGKALMRNADIAMYRAKSQGYNKYLFYDPLMSDDFKKSVEIEFLLKQTNAETDFELFYQPQYALPGNELVGAEALIRWKNPEHGYIPPNVFIPIAEQIDYIQRIGKWVMRQAMRQAVKWNSQYKTPIKVAFNVSPKQLNSTGFIGLIKDSIAESGVNPGWIDAEITESVMMRTEDCIGDIFSALKKLGITVSIDDFGSGYSALGNLNKYQFERIKIDKSLIDNISANSISGSNVVRAAIDMAHAWGIQAIAEGVEKQEQLDVLIQLGCDQAQGYLLGRPVPADIFELRYIKQPF